MAEEAEAQRLAAVDVTEAAAEAEQLADEPAISMKLVSLVCPPKLSAVAFSNSLMEAGALYVGVSDGNAGTNAEEPIFHAHDDDDNPETWDELMAAKKLWSNSTLEVGFAPSADVGRAMLSVVADAGLAIDYHVEDLAPKDWVTDVQANWPPVALPGCLTIRFPWHAASDVDESHGPVVTLHPGMAFGTGEHQTTQLCCLALKELLAAGRHGGCDVLDYGSGSGIPSFAALLFGAGKAVGVEIDPEALAASRANAAENGLTHAFTAELPDEEAQRGQTYPIVVANILAGTLIELSDLLTDRVAPGGTLLMSGIWEADQVERVRACFAGRGFVDEEVEVQYAEGGWALVKARKEAAAA